MYEDLQIPEEVPAAERERLRQYVLTSGEVARMLGVSQQAVYQWAGEQLIDALYEQPTRDGSYGYYRFNLAGVVERAKGTGRKIRMAAIPPRLMLNYDVKVLSEHPELVIMIGDPEGPEPGWISENEAAKVLGVKRPSLRNWRVRGVLNPKLRLRPRDVGTTGGFEYFEQDVLAVSNGELVLRTDEPVDTGTTNLPMAKGVDS